MSRAPSSTSPPRRPPGSTVSTWRSTVAPRVRGREPSTPGDGRLPAEAGCVVDRGPLVDKGNTGRARLARTTFGHYERRFVNQTRRTNWSVTPTRHDVCRQSPSYFVHNHKERTGALVKNTRLGPPRVRSGSRMLAPERPVDGRRAGLAVDAETCRSTTDVLPRDRCPR